MSTNYRNTGTSKSKIITPITLLVLALGGIIFWLAKRSGQSSSSGTQGFKEKAQEANEQIDKEELKAGFQRVVELVKTGASDLQKIYENQGKDLINQTQQVKDQVEDVVSTAKDAGEELKEMKNTTGEEAKEELQGVKEAAKVESSTSSETNEEEETANQTVPPYTDPRI
ncbi:MAG: hypothetical protein EA344_09910 [Alkalicoccus sp.]|nr:MAG: hypothetical protein EA344_09910 [Alkalicoccus sp.]